MRRGVLISLSLLVVSVIAVSVFLAYSNYKQELSYDDMKSINKTVDDKGYFKGSYKCNLKGKYICGFDYDLQGDSLYFTIYVTPNKEKAMPTNNEGYVTGIVYVGNDIKNITYVADGEETAISFGKQN